MIVLVNGEPREVRQGTTLAAVVAAVSDATAGIAVAVDDDVVIREAWDRIRLHEKARIEILTARQGG